jgi:hypothetical protein
MSGTISGCGRRAPRIELCTPNGASSSSQEPARKTVFPPVHAGSGPTALGRRPTRCSLCALPRASDSVTRVRGDAGVPAHAEPTAAPDVPAGAARRGIVVSVLATLSIPTLFVGFPFILGAGGVALGLLGRGGSRHRLATAAVVIGMLVVMFAAGVYVVLGDSEA